MKLAGGREVRGVANRLLRLRRAGHQGGAAAAFSRSGVWGGSSRSRSAFGSRRRQGRRQAPALRATALRATVRTRGLRARRTGGRRRRQQRRALRAPQATALRATRAAALRATGRRRTALRATREEAAALQRHPLRPLSSGQRPMAFVLFARTGTSEASRMRRTSRPHRPMARSDRRCGGEEPEPEGAPSEF